MCLHPAGVGLQAAVGRPAVAGNAMPARLVLHPALRQAVPPVLLNALRLPEKPQRVASELLSQPDVRQLRVLPKSDVALRAAQRDVLALPQDRRLQAVQERQLRQQ